VEDWLGQLFCFARNVGLPTGEKSWRGQVDMRPPVRDAPRMSGINWSAR